MNDQSCQFFPKRRPHQNLPAGLAGVCAFTIALTGFFAQIPAVHAANPSAESIAINNEGVNALKANAFDKAISKLLDSARRSPGYKLPLENLAIAYNNVGLQSTAEPWKALKNFHMAIWVNPDSNAATNKTSLENLNVTIKAMTKNPGSFDDRVALAEESLKKGDFAGGVVEYSEALKLKEDPAIRSAMEKIEIPPEWKDIAFSKKEAAKPRTEAAADVDFGPYMADLQRRIKRAWFPPRGKESARLAAKFKIHSAGEVSDLMIDKSSGVAAADKAGLEAVTKAAPFRPLPEGAPAVVDILFTFDYNVFTNELYRLKRNLETAGHDNEPAEVVVAALSKLGQYYVNNEKGKDAKPIFEKEIKLLEKHKIPGYFEDYVSLGDMYYEDDEFALAEPVYRKVHELCIADPSLGPELISRAKRDLAFTLLYLDDASAEQTAECKKLFDEALAMAEKLRDDEFIVDIKYGIGHYYWQKGDYANALENYKWVATETERLEGPETATVLQRIKDVADCLYELKKPNDALFYYKRVLEIASRIPDADKEEVAEAKTRTDELCHSLGIPTEKQIAHEKDKKKSIDKAYSWLPYALGGTLIALLVMQLLGQGQNSSIDIAGKKSRKDS